jgi:hypothetical protein
LGLLRTLGGFVIKDYFVLGLHPIIRMIFWMYSFLLVVVKRVLFGIVENLRGFCHKGLFCFGGSSYYRNDF